MSIDVDPLVERLRVLELSGVAIAGALGMDARTVQRWLNGAIRPAGQSRRRIAAWLEGPDAPQPPAPPPPAPSPVVVLATADPLVERLRALKLSGAAIAGALGMDARTVQRWLSGAIRPTGPSRHRIAAWLEGPDAPQPPAPPPAPSPAPEPQSAQEETVLIRDRIYLTDDELERFGLPGDPFDDPATPDKAFLHPAFISAENALWQAIRRQQIVILTADPGSGKSVLLRRAIGRTLTSPRIRFILSASIDRARLGHADLCIAILRDLTGQDTSSMAAERRSELLRATLAEQREQGTFPCLLIDEAHLLRNDALIALKHIWDSHTLFRQLAIALVGHPSLRARLLTDPSLRELTGRARLVELPPLSESLTADYLRWRFALVERDADAVFDGGAYKVLSARGQVAMWINNLAARAMRVAYEAGDVQVTAEHVGRA